MPQQPRKSSLGALTLAALGVVYGDIGTSPLYTMREVFAVSRHPVPVTPENVLGILSLIFWSLILIVTVKYAAFILRADNHGEGGVMALMALVQRVGDGRGPALTLLGLFGAALFYGDGAITPAISVLSAVEGLEVATPALRPWVLPIAIGILFALFRIQRQGTGRVGRLFGPITTVWFVTLAVLGIANIADQPRVFEALSPAPGIDFFVARPGLAFLSLGAVILAVTGAETLYADMGHFGRLPVRLAWLGLVLPALTLNYLGQGALLLADPGAVAHPFYGLAPAWALYTPRPEKVPHSLLHSLKHYRCLHERVVILEIRFTNTPFVPAGRRVEVEPLGGRFFRVRATFGFMDQPHLTRTLHTCASQGLVCDATESTFFLGRETLIPSAKAPMAYWRQLLFIAMSRNAGGPGAYFGIAPNRVVELGAQMTL